MDKIFRSYMPSLKTKSQLYYRDNTISCNIVMETHERVYNSAKQYSEDILKIFSLRDNKQATIRRNTKLYSNNKSFKVDDKV